MGFLIGFRTFVALSQYNVYALKYLLCPQCKKKIAEPTIFSNASALARVDICCPGCLKRLRFALSGATKERFESYFRSTYPYYDDVRGYLRVVENVFGYSALLPLALGVNTIGRYNGKGTSVSLAIHSDDPSMDRNHALLWILPDGSCEIMDDDSMTGTFVNGVELDPLERRPLSDGDTLTLGATSVIYIQMKE